MVKAIITAAEAVEILRGAGFAISVETLKVGIQQGQFPFGSYVRAEGLLKTDRCFIYIWPMYRWLEHTIMGYRAPEEYHAAG